LLLDTSGSMRTEDAQTGDGSRSTEFSKWEQAKSDKQFNDEYAGWLFKDRAGSIACSTPRHRQQSPGCTQRPLVSRLDAALECLQGFVQAHHKTSPADVFSIATFSDDAEVVGETMDAKTACEILECTRPWCSDGTFYSVALRTATELRALTPAQQTHIIMLSDGRPADAKVALDFLQSEFLGRGTMSVRLHGIGFGAVAQSFAPLQQLVCLTGGTFVHSSCSIRGLTDAFTKVSTTMASSASSHFSFCDIAQHTTERNSKTNPLYELRPATFEEVELSGFGRRGVLRFSAAPATFRYDGQNFKIENSTPRNVARRLRPQLCGGMRLVYAFRDEEVMKPKSHQMVAKVSRYLHPALNSRTVVESHAKSTAVARYYASKFNEQRKLACPQSPEISFVPCLMYNAESSLPNGEPLCFAAEEHLPGIFLKYNSNNGFTSDHLIEYSEAVQAFTHYTWVASGCKMLVADLQGVAQVGKVRLTDPQVVSMECLFGPGNLGAPGVCECLMAHRCGRTCRSLGLPPISYTDLRLLKATTKKVSAMRSSPLSGFVQSSCSESVLSASWECISDSHFKSGVDTEWEEASTKPLMEFALNEPITSSQVSSSSWVDVLQA